MVAKVKRYKGHTIISCNCKAPKGGLKPWMLFVAIAAAGTTTFLVTSLINQHIFGGTGVTSNEAPRKKVTKIAEGGSAQWAEGY